MGVIFLKQGFDPVCGGALEGLIGQHNDLCTKSRKSPLDGGLRQEFKHASTELGNSLQLVAVSQEDRDVLTQLAGHDHVHSYGAESIDDLLKCRAGGDGASKQTFALVKPGGDGEERQVLAAIYGHMDVVPESNGIIHCSQLKGNVRDILTADIQEVAQPNLVTFYSVTAFEKRGVKGVASLLINRLHAHVRENMPSIRMISTLSPARGFGKWAERQELRDLRQMSDLNLKRQMLSYVSDFAAHAYAPDFARNLHVKDNGAMVGWFHTRANAAGSQDDVYGDGLVVPMVNYLYPLEAEALEEQRIQNLSGDVGVHPDLRAELDLAA